MAYDGSIGRLRRNVSLIMTVLILGASPYVGLVGAADGDCEALASSALARAECGIGSDADALWASKSVPESICVSGASPPCVRASTGLGGDGTSSVTSARVDAGATPLGRAHAGASSTSVPGAPDGTGYSYESLRADAGVYGGPAGGSHASAEWYSFESAWGSGCDSSARAAVAPVGDSFQRLGCPAGGPVTVGSALRAAFGAAREIVRPARPAVGPIEGIELLSLVMCDPHPCPPLPYAAPTLAGEHHCVWGYHQFCFYPDATGTVPPGPHAYSNRVSCDEGEEAVLAPTRWTAYGVPASVGTHFTVQWSVWRPHGAPSGVIESGSVTFQYTTAPGVYQTVSVSPPSSAFTGIHGAPGCSPLWLTIPQSLCVQNACDSGPWRLFGA